MKVGVISKGSPDYLIDIVTDGLIRLMGRQNLSLDYNFRGGAGGAYVHLGKNFAGPEPFDIHDSDVLIASSRSGPAISAWIKKTGKTKVACIDGEDDDAIRENCLHQVKTYFKREYLKGRAYSSKIRPLPFAAIPETTIGAVPLREPPVFYMGHPNHADRKWVAEVLTSMGFMPSTARIEKADYNRMLMGSLVGVSARGGGWDTYRYWEIPFFGAMLLSQRLGTVIPADFIEGAEALFFTGPQELKARLSEMLKDRTRARNIAEAGKIASRRRHLSYHRAKTVLEAIS